MAKIDSYISSFLSADDLTEGPRLIGIESVIEERIGQDTKLVLYAEGLNGVGCPLNKGNLQKLADIFGSRDTDDWEGKLIVVYRDPSVQYQGKKVGGISFRKPKEGAKLADSAIPF
jgi:hypothetical protein